MTQPHPQADPLAAAAALSVTAGPQAPLSAAARAFNLQLTRIDKLKSQLRALDALAQSHRQAVHDALGPLHEAHAQSMREMVRLLDQRLATLSLSRLQRETGRELLCGLARTLAQDGDAEMAALHDKHHPQPLAELEQADKADLREQLEDMLGEPLDGLQEGASFDDLMAAGMARMRQAQEAEQERRRAAAAKRKARKKPGAAQAAAQALMDDAQSSLRSLFRQLASMLHPDRETDAQLRQTKTALMSEANAAYERRDLVTLLRIQQRALGADPLAAARLSEDKLAALTQLLKQQVAELERERASRSGQLAAEFEVAPGVALTPQTLQRVLKAQVEDLQEEIALMQRDLRLVQDNAGLKRWLSEQRRLTQQMREMEDWGFT